ncbi:MAG: cell division protein FtsW [Phycisphaerales bacterium]|nr:MAG: cell division protein FtsW [Phycisphaerales bacterium]
MVRSGQAVALCALALLMVGVVMVNSASMSVSPIGPQGRAGDDQIVTVASILLSRSTFYMVLAVGAMAVCALLPVRRIADRLTAGSGVADHPLAGLGVLILATVALLGCMALVYVPGLSREVNGSTRWIGITIPAFGALSVQPSEIAKWALPAVLAIVAAKRARWMPTLTLGMAPAMLAVGAVCALVMIEDFGTAALMGVAALAVLLAGGVRLIHLALLAPAALLGLGVALVHSPYRIQRLVSFADPWADPQGSGYHMIQSLQTVAGGELWGRGLGHGLQKFGYLPEDTTDFLFAVICEELGVIGAGVVIALQAALVLAVYAVARREAMGACKLFALGVLATLGGQAAINLAVVTGLGPTKGIALPLVSSGGTGWFLTCAALGLVISIARTQPVDDAATDEAEAWDEGDEDADTIDELRPRRRRRADAEAEDDDLVSAPEVFRRDRASAW